MCDDLSCSFSCALPVWNRLGAIQAMMLVMANAVREQREAEAEWLDVLEGMPMIGTPRLKAAELALIAAENDVRALYAAE
jgi:hypothetical protein